MGDIPYIWFRGKRMTPAVRDALLAAEQRAGFNFVVTQGGFNAGGVVASAGTHDGDALDLRTRDLDKAKVTKMIEAMRWAGFAAWYRTSGAQYGVRAQGFTTPHVHAVPNGWGLPSAGARAQAAAYRARRDGLARNLADIGPGHVSTWRTKTRPEKPDLRTPLERLLDDMDINDLRKIIREETNAATADLKRRITTLEARVSANTDARAQYAYQQVIDGGAVTTRLDRLEGRATATTDARAQYAYRQVVSGGDVANALDQLRGGIARLTERVDALEADDEPADEPEGA